MRTQKLIIRWSLATGCLIALFWAIYYLVAGSVPTVTSIKMTNSWTYVLPFGISRWWDILIGPIWSTIIILLVTNKKLRENDDLQAGLGVGLAAGLGVLSNYCSALSSGPKLATLCSPETSKHYQEVCLAIVKQTSFFC